jgi:hypothetical protein
MAANFSLHNLSTKGTSPQVPERASTDVIGGVQFCSAPDTNQSPPDIPTADENPLYEGISGFEPPIDPQVFGKLGSRRLALFKIKNVSFLRSSFLSLTLGRCRPIISSPIWPMSLL